MMLMVLISYHAISYHIVSLSYQSRLAAIEKQNFHEAELSTRAAIEWEQDETRRRQEQQELSQILNQMNPQLNDIERQQRYTELVARQQIRQSQLDAQRRKRNKEERKQQYEMEREEEKRNYGFGEQKGQTPLYIAYKRKHYRLAVMLYDKGRIISWVMMIYIMYGYMHVP